MNPEKNKKSNQLKLPIKSLYLLAIVSVGVVTWVSIGSLTKYGLQIKLSESYIPTMINGITTSTSVVIALFIAVLGIMLRVSIEKKDFESRQFYLVGMIVLLIPIGFFWSTYLFLAMGLSTIAVTYSLDALIGALFICIVLVIFTVVRVSNQTEKEDPTVGDDM